MQDIPRDEERDMGSLIGSLDFPNDTFHNTSILEPPQFGLVAPKVSESFRHGCFGLLGRRSVVNQSESVFGVKDKPNVDDGLIRWMGLGSGPYWVGGLEDGYRFRSVSESGLE